MTRVKQSAEDSEKKESNKKHSSNKSITTVWPCKINGCKKEFGREADLKRHQRTTKLHATPEQQPVGCPQCDATFTRIDALRRHQKSRCERILERLKQGEGPEGSNASGSRSGTPNKSKGEGSSAAPVNAIPASEPVPTMMIRPDPPGQIGSTSYYRQHTIHPVFVAPRTPHGILNISSYQTTQIPMSATRFNGPITYVPAPPGSYYPPGAYYRTPDSHPIGSMSIAHLSTLPPGSVTMQVNPAPAVPPLAQPPVQPQRTDGIENSNSHATNGVSFDAGINAAVQKALQAVLAIDPSLNDAVQQILPQAVLATQNALKASEASERSGTALSQEKSAVAAETSRSESRMKEGEIDSDFVGEAGPERHVTTDQNDSMSMMTEDGVAMLRPDELLNEETLSYPSPPP